MEKKNIEEFSIKNMYLYFSSISLSRFFVYRLVSISLIIGLLFDPSSRILSQDVFPHLVVD